MSKPKGPEVHSSAITEIADRQRTMARNLLERKALREGYIALAESGPEAAVAVLEAYAPAIARLAPINRRVTVIDSHTPTIGALAWHLNGLDPRTVTRVSPDGESIWLYMLTSEAGPFRAANYTYTREP